MINKHRPHLPSLAIVRFQKELIPPEYFTVTEANQKHLAVQPPSRPEQRPINDSGRKASKRFTMMDHQSVYLRIANDAPQHEIARGNTPMCEVGM